MWVKIFKDEDEAKRKLQPDRPQLLIIGDLRLSLVLHNNIFYAVQDFCSHNKESLSKGTINFKGEIICPWHGYCFDLQTGRESLERSADLNVYEIRIDSAGFCIHIPESK
jgi:nitrite reductase/ring-hydroxylating ferredoxin subunit